MHMLNESVYLLLGYGYNCNSYLIKSHDEALLIDSGLGKYGKVWGYSEKNPFDEILETIDSHKVSRIAITHAHLDHTGGIASLDKQSMDIKILAHKNEAPYLEASNSAYIDPIFKTEVETIKIDRILSNNDKIKIGDLSLTVIHTAGHTEGSLCLFEEEKGWLFSGDTVFPQGSFGRVDFYGSNSDDMIQSLDTLRSLNVSSLFAGHMQPLLDNVSQSIDLSYKNAKFML